MKQALVPRTVGIGHSAQWYLIMILSRTGRFNITIILTDLQIQVILNQNHNCSKISNLTNKAKIYMEMQKAKNSQDT